MGAKTLKQRAERVALAAGAPPLDAPASPDGLPELSPALAEAVADVAVEEAAPAAAELPAFPVEEASVVSPVPVPTRFRVRAAKTISWFGSITHLAEGSEIDARSYGEAGMRRLSEQGVQLDPVD